MDDTPLRELPTAEQERRLLDAARDLLPAFDLAGADVTLLQHEFNATCRLDHPDGTFAMRLNISSPWTAAQVAGELAWVTALGEDGVHVPTPRPARDEPVPTVRIEGVGRDVPAVVFGWLPGDDLGALVDDDPAGAVPWLRGLGRVMGRLHEHAAAWSLPDGVVRPRYDSVLLGGEYGLSTSDGPWRTAELDAALTATWSAIEARTTDVLATDHRLLHADLHPWNAKVVDDGTTPVVFDFDDAGLGNPVLDLAIATFYLRDEPPLEAALHEGLATTDEGAALVEHVGTPAFEAMVAGRQWLLLDDVVCNPIGALPDFDVLAYGRKVTARLEHWLGTGRFTLDP